MTAPTPLGSRAERRGPLEKGLLFACPAIFVLGLATMGLGRGEIVRVSTNVQEATVSIDAQRQPVAFVDGAYQFVRIPRGTRRVTAVHRDFVPADQTINVALFGSKRYEVAMTPLMVRLHVVTQPMAQVLLNGKPIGTADDQGALSVEVASGEYTIEAQLAGYEAEARPIEVRGRNPRAYAPLRMTEAKRQELASRQEQANEFMQQARTLFAQRNYSAALKAAEDALKLAPQDSSARQLRDQIAETIQILK